MDFFGYSTFSVVNDLILISGLKWLNCCLYCINAYMEVGGSCSQYNGELVELFYVLSGVSRQ